MDNLERIGDLIDVQFASFQNVLKSNLAGLEVAQQLCQLKRLQEDNRRLDDTVDKLTADVRRWLLVKNQLLKVTGTVAAANAAVAAASDRNNNLVLDDDAKISTTEEDVKEKALPRSLAVDFVSDDTTKEILDAFAKDIGSQIEHWEPKVVLAQCKAPSPIRKLSSAAFKTNRRRRVRPLKAATGKVKKEVAKVEAVITRSRRGVKGISLVDPFKYHDCLKCKAGYYRELDLRIHYRKKHGLDFGDAGLPTDELQLQCLQTDRQSSTKCNICGVQFKSVDEAMVHKTNSHVDNKFRRHACPSCPMRFVFAKELQDHQMVHSVQF